MSTEESRPFLEAVGEDENVKKSRKSWMLIVSVVSNMGLLLACLFLSITVLSLSNSKTTNTASQRQITEPYSPANDIIEYEYRPIIANDTRFTGHPGPEWEQSMHGLMEGTLIRISKDELYSYGSDSIPLEDGGYAAGLGVAHNLHCVKKIKKFLYREHFYPNLIFMEGEFDYVQSHADHCLDFLRQSIMCHLDFSLYTLYWGERQQDIPTHHLPDVQKCVNWDKLHSWMLERAANVDKLVGP